MMFPCRLARVGYAFTGWC